MHSHGRASCERRRDDHGINVTPLVDITLVLLVILMVTASYVTSRAIPMELPKGATGEGTPTTMTISIDKDGKTFLDAETISEAGLRAKIKAVHDADPETRAIIAADGRTGHANVVHVIDLLRREDVTRFAINIDPDEAERSRTTSETRIAMRNGTKAASWTGVVLASVGLHAAAFGGLGRHAGERVRLEAPGDDGGDDHRPSPRAAAAAGRTGQARRVQAAARHGPARGKGPLGGDAAARGGTAGRRQRRWPTSRGRRSPTTDPGQPGPAPPATVSG